VIARPEAFPRIAVVALLVSVLGASFAWASEPAEVEALIEQANKFRRDGKDGKALPLMRKAYDMATTARTAAQLGLVEVALGYWLQAEQHLTEALSSPRDPWIHQNRSELERVLTAVRSSIGEVHVEGEPVGAEVLVNGQSVGVLPLVKPARVGDGPVRLEVRARGYRTSTQTITMSKGGAQRVDVRLARDGAAATPAQANPPRTAGSPPSIVRRAPQTGGTGGSSARTAAWLTGAAAVVAVGVGVGGSVMWRGRRDEFDSHTAPVLDNAGMATSRRKDCGVQNDNRGGDECARLYDDMNRAKTVAVIGYVSGGLLAAGAATLFLLQPSVEHRAARGGIACAPTITAVGGACRLMF
jgi:hypothetical protein